MKKLQLKRISKQFLSENGVQTAALRDVSLELSAGGFLAVVGPSGCGKSTLLRIVAGLEAPDSGDILLDGESVLHLPAGQRGVAMVFQSDALFSHMTVRENIAAAAAKRALSLQQQAQLVADIAAQLQITDCLEKKPAELSGGQRQRTDIARALASGAELLLFDEPLSQLDGLLRAQLRALISALHSQNGVSVLYVTHDIPEAFALADTVAVMQHGEVMQIGSPQQLREQPACDFVKEFVGSQL